MSGLMIRPDNLVRLLPFARSLANLASEADVIERARSPPGSVGTSVADLLHFRNIVKGFTLNSPIAYFGGKKLLAPKFIPLFPEHHRYVEVFGGGGAVLFAKPRSPIEVYNDIDQALFDFFWVLAKPTTFAKFKRIVATLPCSSNLHRHCTAQWRTEKSQVTRVAMWYCAQRQSFSSILDNHWSYSVEHSSRGMAQSVSKWLGGIERLPEAHARLQSVGLDNRDFRKVIKAYDRPDTFFYLDPPYAPETRKGGGYPNELKIEDHHDLVRMLLELKGKAMLSGYATDLYLPLEKNGWCRKEFNVVCSAAGKTRSSGLTGKGSSKGLKRTEVVWANYPLPP